MAAKVAIQKVLKLLKQKIKLFLNSDKHENTVPDKEKDGDGPCAWKRYWIALFYEIDRLRT